ncbi:hypothetical protein [Ruegeria sp.]|uniref:hypothetical protein n=1 Tax=Ruegeria sp. TaxID=1879320 RepID=UPI00232138DC|nr:hypothetical protein [Ruegeria sp.]MDA7963068.1 hypothetical protein [Ruegeria sp.]
MRDFKTTAFPGVLAALLLVSACGGSGATSDRLLFDGKSFRASAKPVDKKAAPGQFRVTVSGVSASLDGAREAGRHEGTRFCIQNFGSSRIVWTVGPDTEPQKLRIEKDKLTFAGTCQRP